MTNEEIISKCLEAKKGTYLTVKKLKDLGSGIQKISDLRIRINVSYANMKINENRETGSLPWGHWVDGLENLVIEHKGKYYLRVTSTTPQNPESGADVIKTTYLQAGQEITKEEVLAMLGEKALEGNASPVYNVKFENILAIGGSSN